MKAIGRPNISIESPSRPFLYCAISSDQSPDGVLFPNAETIEILPEPGTRINKDFDGYTPWQLAVSRALIDAGSKHTRKF